MLEPCNIATLQQFHGDERSRMQALPKVSSVYYYNYVQTKTNEPELLRWFYLAHNGEHIQRIMTGACTVVIQTDRPVTVYTKTFQTSKKDPGAHTYVPTQEVSLFLHQTCLQGHQHTNKNKYTQS